MKLSEKDYIINLKINVRYLYYARIYLLYTSGQIVLALSGMGEVARWSYD